MEKTAKILRVVLTRMDFNAIRNNESKRTDVDDSGRGIENCKKQRLSEDTNNTFIAEVSGYDKLDSVSSTGFNKESVDGDYIPVISSATSLVRKGKTSLKPR